MFLSLPMEATSRAGVVAAACPAVNIEARRVFDIYNLAASPPPSNLRQEMAPAQPRIEAKAAFHTFFLPMPPLPMPPPKKSFSQAVTMPKPKPKFRKWPVPEGGYDSKTCGECGKSFSSPKALFGHMRCHPERPYRGINPPPRPSSSNDEYDVAQSLLLLSRCSTRKASSSLKASQKSNAASSPPEKKRARHEETESSEAEGANRHDLGSTKIINAAGRRSISKSYYTWDLNLPPPSNNGEGGPFGN